MSLSCYYGVLLYLAACRGLFCRKLAYEFANSLYNYIITYQPNNLSAFRFLLLRCIEGIDGIEALKAPLPQPVAPLQGRGVQGGKPPDSKHVIHTPGGFRLPLLSGYRDHPAKNIDMRERYIFRKDN